MLFELELEKLDFDNANPLICLSQFLKWLMIVFSNSVALVLTKDIWCIFSESKKALFIFLWGLAQNSWWAQMNF